MPFKDRLKQKRMEANLTQPELAEKAGVTTRTIQNYELGKRKPAHVEVVQKIADVLHTTTEYLLSSGSLVRETPANSGSFMGETPAGSGSFAGKTPASSGAFMAKASGDSGAKEARDLHALVGEVSGLFAGGLLSDEELENAMKVLYDAYWSAKEKSKKCRSKKDGEESGAWKNGNI